MSERYPTGDRRGARGGGRGRQPRDPARRAGRAADRHRLRHRRRRLRPGRRRGPARGQGPRPRDAAAGAGLARPPRSTRSRPRCPATPGRWSRSSGPARSPWSATQQSSLQWDLGDTRGTVAVRMPDHELALRDPRAHRPARGQLGQHAPAARPPPTPTRPRRCSASDVAVLVDAGDVARRRGLDDRRRHRHARAGCCGAGALGLEQLNAVLEPLGADPDRRATRPTSAECVSTSSSSWSPRRSPTC